MRCYVVCGFKKWGSSLHLCFWICYYFLKVTYPGIISRKTEVALKMFKYNKHLNLARQCGIGGKWYHQSSLNIWDGTLWASVSSEDNEVRWVELRFSHGMILLFLFIQICGHCRAWRNINMIISLILISNIEQW